MRPGSRVRTRFPATTSRRRASAGELIEDFLAITPSASRERYRRALMVWVNWCAAERVGVLSVRPEDVVRHLEQMQEAGSSAGTRAARLTVLRGLYRYLHAAGHLHADPTSVVRRPRVVKVSRGTWLTRLESRALLDAADADPDPAVSALVWMYAMHGMRLSEPLSLDVGDVRIVRDRVVITITRKGYEGARGDFLLAEEVGRRLLVAIGDRTEGPALVHHNGGRIPGNAARKIVAGTAMRAGITVPVTPHALRRTFVTLGRDAGISDRDLQASTGHLTAQMIGYYDRARDSVTRDGGDQLATYLGISTGQTPAPRADPERPATLGPLNTTQLAALGRERGARARRLAADRVESVADLIAQGMTLPQIAEQIGISLRRATDIVRRHDLPEPRTPAVIHREQVRELAARGLPSTVIAREIGLSTDGVLAIIHRHNLPWPRPDARTPAARAARQARALVLVEQGATRREIAADLGVGISTVGRYLTGTALGSGRRWTAEERQIAVDRSHSVRQAAEILGRTPQGVQYARSELDRR